ncbi:MULTISPECIES: DEAD/DEAH box helicase family protein [Dehalobacter]|jgi:type III restriction enzyme|uniref:Restriction endonuclease n=2 Tax=Dehalobacter restrictus TaxID=55583 RepID=A0A857DEX7_9FIRM|nr:MULTISPECIES: DEAD/DEAH box helicase family protein [Dehalobacter]AHF09274.1 type III restriction endonuclease subunit R [Dehalobacter restrictus DSM 9455]MCG1024503.1 DEAD/DEAH box helicase family protein [Dehalobacter sp.]MDJ0306523.1 DEAD/DEAH box helicase family protein [Dehalobacter sp.]OCZ50417.1 restriction endonuclease [Dehalobacter sp. TeCB1]QGZ99813.1 restriction endonuclease [Dehalobacter restrictus]
MELKNYQKKTISDLDSYLSFLNSTHNMITAYQEHWNAQDVRIGFGGVPQYRDTIPGTPHVCFKVPTGGGKTFMACASVKPIFDAMPMGKPRVVAWLVPSNSILEQTIKTLSDVNHPYRQRLDFDFAGRVVVYTKEQLLSGQGFNPTAVREQLSVCILSYDSIRSNKKDGRKVYQENSQLAPFTKSFTSPETMIADIDDTALIQVLNQLSPVVIVDESHNAQSDLSVEMLNNLNPSFVLDLTATPKSNSNIISYVDARELKSENMVKLPVVVYNRTSRQSVIADAIQLRGSIEQQALAEEAAGGAYIRPIVLVQAQSKVHEDSETFDKIKTKLIDMGIPNEQIAIKTANINELKNVNLMSRACPIRYIITVNALKEGWDCPFAYILASLANKTSAVDVEQILGRILRQPYARRHRAPLLNTSYVLTSSNDFRDTLENIVKGLNKAGFSRKDFRLGGETQTSSIPEPGKPEQPDLLGALAPEEDDFEDIAPEAVRAVLEGGVTDAGIAGMLDEAQKKAEEYNAVLTGSEGSGLFGGELGEMMNQCKIQEQFSDEALSLQIPQLFLKTAPSLFGGEYTLLTKEALSDGFSLNGQDAQISFELATGEMYRVDIDKFGEAVPKYQLASKAESEYLRERLARLPEEGKTKLCTSMICNQINRSNQLAATEVNEYVTRIIKKMTEDELAALETSVSTYARKIQQKIETLEDIYRENRFDRMLDGGAIVCRPTYVLPKVITPVDSTESIPKSLYDAEKNDMNDFEFRVINTIVSLDNIKWWHRIADRKSGEFVLNGFIHHYPDFMVMTKSGILILLETKGDYLANDENKAKLNLGRKWQAQSGTQYRYFMVFKDKNLKVDGAYILDEFVEMIKGL